MSVHIKENTKILAKKGSVGNRNDRIYCKLTILNPGSEARWCDELINPAVKVNA
jgi:predicted PilT family ATPase